MFLTYNRFENQLKDYNQYKYIKNNKIINLQIPPQICQIPITIMNSLQHNVLQSVTRAHSFINRTPHTVLNISRKNNWVEIVQMMKKDINVKCRDGSKNTKINVKCVRIQQCRTDQEKQRTNQNNSKISLMCCQIVCRIFENLSKLAITKCNMTSFSFYPQDNDIQSNRILFPNLQQVDLSKNKLKNFPQFIYTAPKLNKIDVSSNSIEIIPYNLTTMMNLKHLKVLDNPVTKISSTMLLDALNGNTILEIQWKLILLIEQMNTNNYVGQSIPSMRTTMTEGDEIPFNMEQLQKYGTSQQNNQQTNVSKQHYINIPVTVVEKLRVCANQKDKIFEDQIQMLIMTENITYLQYISQLFDEKKLRKYIDMSFKNKKYQVLDYLLSNYHEYQQKYQETHEKVKQKENHRVKSKKKLDKHKKDDKENMLGMGRRKVKMLTIKTTLQRQHLPQFHLNNLKMRLNEESKGFSSLKAIARTTKSINTETCIEKLENIDFKIKIPESLQYLQAPTKNNLERRNKNPQQKNSEQIFIQSERPFNLSQYLILQKMTTYNPIHIQTIPKQFLKFIKLDQLIWLLNQLQLIQSSSKNNEEIKQVFGLEQFKIIINNLIKSEDVFQYIFNSTSYKKSIKLILMHSQMQFLEKYNFGSISILKSILSIGEFELIKYIEGKYPSFYEALFKNIIYDDIDPTFTINSMFVKEISLTKSILSPQCCSISWKRLVNPHSKLYKYLYKQHKIYIRNHLNNNQTKIWHFPQYVPSQMLLAKNEISSNKILQDYEDFQTIKNEKDLRLQFRPTNLSNTVSIAKKIYMQVLDEAKNSVRSIGKTKERQKIKIKHNKEGTIALESFRNRDMRKNTSLGNISLFKSIPASPIPSNATHRENNKSSNEKFENKYRYTRKSSIYVFSKQKCKQKQSTSKTKEGRKVGISLCSNSVTFIRPSQNVFGAGEKQKNMNRTVYLNLSKSNTKTPISSNAKSYINMLNSESHNQKQIQQFLDPPEIVCSTFDSR